MGQLNTQYRTFSQIYQATNIDLFSNHDLLQTLIDSGRIEYNAQNQSLTYKVSFLFDKL